MRSSPAEEWIHTEIAPNTGDPAFPWRGLHIRELTQKRLPQFRRAIKEIIAPMGFNIILLEVNYSFDFQSHPEMSRGGITASEARELTELCRKHGINLIPLFNTLGHQSNYQGPFPLLKHHPEFREPSPRWYRGKATPYLGWCPRQNALYPIVFDLVDEIIDAFDAKAIHLGMDEVFAIGLCDRCREAGAGTVFTEHVLKMHKHVVLQRGVEMLMWADRLLPAQEMYRSPYESSKNGTHTAIEQIPTDIILCDWHYVPRRQYPSLAYLMDHGFRVWPSTWQNIQSAERFTAAARRASRPRMLGMMFTTWNSGPGAWGLFRLLWPGVHLRNASKSNLKVEEVLRTMMRKLAPRAPYWSQD